MMSNLSGGSQVKKSAATKSSEFPSGAARWYTQNHIMHTEYNLMNAEAQHGPVVYVHAIAIHTAKQCRKWRTAAYLSGLVNGGLGDVETDDEAAGAGERDHVVPLHAQHDRSSGG